MRKKSEQAETGLTTPITWMLSVTTAIDRPKSAPQLLCHRMCVSIFHSKFSINFKLKLGAAVAPVAEWLSSWRAGQEVQGSIPRLAT